MNKKWLLFLCIGSLILSLFVLKTDVIASGNKIFVSSSGTGQACLQISPCRPAAGLNKAVDGDTLYFQQGTYTGISDPILNVTKGVSLIGGWNGPSTEMVIINPLKYETIIDGGDQRQLVSIATDSDETVFITGFTFKNGNTQSVSMKNGGAIHVEQGGVIIEFNRFENNHADWYGGAIRIESKDDVIVRDNTFENNSVGLGGGAVSTLSSGAENQTITIEGNEFIGGSANHGTAIAISSTHTIITRNMFMDNPGEYALSFSFSVDGPSSIISNNFIIRAKSALWFSNFSAASQKVWNNTIVDCTFGINGYTANLEIVNNIITNTATSISNNGENIAGSNNLFYNNTNDPFKLNNPVTDKDPLFVDAENDDYHIQDDSPAVDAGTSVALKVDFDGERRPSGWRFDIGADEIMKNVFLFLPLILR